MRYLAILLLAGLSSGAAWAGFFPAPETPVPAPGVLALLGIGAAAGWLVRRSGGR